MKAPSKRIELKLAKLTREFFANHPSVKLIAVTGSAGKTSAKIAIGTLLAQTMNIQLRDETPKTRADVFLQIMGVKLPSDDSMSWHKVLKAVKLRARAEHPEVQAIVQEFDPQELGYHAWFRDYLLPDITVVTSVTNGRMQVEYPLEAVAQEMITLANNSKLAIINRDDIDGQFAGLLTNPNITTYGSSSMAEYSFDEHSFSLENGSTGIIISPENQQGLPVNLCLYGEYNLRQAVVAAAVCYKLGVPEASIVQGIDGLRSLPGRMNMFRGPNGAWLIDDSYSSTPKTALSALQMLYSFDVPQRIAVLGNMNGLRGASEQAHTELGAYCHIDMLDWVVTVGEHANTYLAPAAHGNGCQIKKCRDSIEAGAFVREKLEEGAMVLFKGSSGGVWLEEAVKLNLKSPEDEPRLVRQEPAWLERKQDFFTANRMGGDKLTTYNSRYRSEKLGARR